MTLHCDSCDAPIDTDNDDYASNGEVVACGECQRKSAEEAGFAHAVATTEARQQREREAADVLHGDDCPCADCLKLAEYKPAGHSHGIPF